MDTRRFPSKNCSVWRRASVREADGAAEKRKAPSEIMRAAVMCCTDHVCPNCGYTVSGAWDDRHTEWVKDGQGEKIPVCPYREEE